ncbi:MAG: hypothetical protein KKF44_11275 [Nanoarchaeota archaeon]|nr:hypothetical protein [Nanoarchaeota archaeon]
MAADSNQFLDKSLQALVDSGILKTEISDLEFALVDDEVHIRPHYGQIEIDFETKNANCIVLDNSDEYFRLFILNGDQSIKIDYFEYVLYKDCYTKVPKIQKDAWKSRTPRGDQYKMGLDSFYQIATKMINSGHQPYLMQSPTEQDILPLYTGKILWQFVKWFVEEEVDKSQDLRRWIKFKKDDKDVADIMYHGALLAYGTKDGRAAIKNYVESLG